MVAAERHGAYKFNSKHFSTIPLTGTKSDRAIREVDPNFYAYTDVYVGSPSIEEDAFTSTAATPLECRLRDCTYSAPIYVDVKYRRSTDCDHLKSSNRVHTNYVAFL